MINPSLIVHAPEDGIESSLEQVHGLLRQLLDVAEQKLHCLRTADAGGLIDLSSEEARLLEMLATCSAAPEAAGVAPSTVASWSDVVAGLAEPMRSRLAARLAAVRTLAERLRSRNQVVTQAARILQTQIRAVLSAVYEDDAATPTYRKDGAEQAGPRLSSAWVDAVC